MDGDTGNCNPDCLFVYLFLLSFMNEYLIIFIFIAWYVLSLIVSETIGKKRKIGVQWSFFISMMFSPVIGYIVTRLSKESS